MMPPFTAEALAVITAAYEAKREKEAAIKALRDAVVCRQALATYFDQDAATRAEWARHGDDGQAVG
jgi:hypothetical protein